MTREVRQLFSAAVFVVVVALLGLQLHAPAGAVRSAQASDPGAFYVDASGGRGVGAKARDAGFTFDAAVAPSDRQAVIAAVAAARPEARELMDLVDGLVTIRIGGAGAGAVGVTESRPDGTFIVTVDLATVSARYGARGIERVVQHEMGHVVDFAVVPAKVDAELDAAIPSGWGCDGGSAGACAAREERFAETFAKWASGDIGVDLYIGYKVPPPAIPLDTWAAPLARLAAG